MAKTRDAIHVARVIRDRLDGFDPMSGTMEDWIVVGSVKRNRDGSLTVRCQISVDDNATGERWVLPDKLLRLPRERLTGD